MDRASTARRTTALVALTAATLSAPIDAQSGGGGRASDTARTIIIDSVKKVYLSGAGTSPTAVAPDLARTVDAEMRVAVFELTAGQTLAALGRLERVSTLAASEPGAAYDRATLRFLLAQTYQRLGMAGPFRSVADSLLAGSDGARFGPVLRPQLLVDAYSRGDHARAAELARSIPDAQSSGLLAVIGGLAAYQAGNLAEARAAFQRGALAGGETADYARFMDVITQLRGDTAQAAAVLATLEQLASSATGDFADQVRLTAAQVAYEGERYDDAARLAAAVREGSPVAAPALLTRAWALYKLDRVEDAERAFLDYASRYPELPERTEARLMAAQAQLEHGRPADAERVFTQVADSAAVELEALRGQVGTALADLSRAIVAGRAAGLLFAADPVGGKAMVLRDSLDPNAVLAAVEGGAAAAAVVPSRGTLAPVNVAGRLDSLAGGSVRPIVRRVAFAPASATRQPQEVALQAQALAGADAAVAVARQQLDEQVAAEQRASELLERMAASLDGDSATLAGLGAEYRALADSIAGLDRMTAAAEARLREMLGREIEATRAAAAENARAADSLRVALAPAAAPEDRATLETEAGTAAAYLRIAELAQQGLGNAISRHPTFVLRDSLRARSAKAQALLADLEGAYAGARRGLAEALAALRGGGGPGSRAARQALETAEARRAAVEAQAVAAVTAELSARATELAAGLQRDVEAAQFGTASAAFFQAIDGTRAVGETESGTAPRGTVGPASRPAASSRSGSGPALPPPSPAATPPQRRR